MSATMRLWAAALGVALAGAAGGCSSHPDSTSTGQTGTLSVPLTGSAPSGTPYHLANAVFEVTNFFVSPAIDQVVSGDDPTLLVDLPPSVTTFDYQIVLRDGWSLNAVNADRTETPLSATLVSGNPVSFTIKPQRTTPVTFQFKASEQIVTTGDGTAAVNVAVDDTLIDDFEDGDGQIAPLGGRSGSWFTFNDGSGTQVPAPGSPVVPQVVDTSANFLLRTTGNGFALLNTSLGDGGSTAFGAGVGANLLFDATAGQARPYDASGYSGLQFQVSLQSTANVPLQLSFLVGTSATTPVEFGGTCTTGCFDDFGFVGEFFPSDFLDTFQFPWSQLRQQGFGTPATFDPATIITIKWVVAFLDFGQTTSSNDFDLRLDNISFLPGVGLGGAQASAVAVASDPPDAGASPPVARAAVAPASSATQDAGSSAPSWNSH